MPDGASCGTCRYWHKLTDGCGECRQRSPSASSFWPQTRRDEWCGQFISLERIPWPTGNWSVPVSSLSSESSESSEPLPLNDPVSVPQEKE